MVWSQLAGIRTPPIVTTDFLYINNHYAGFGPGTANTFRKMLDLSEASWNGVKLSKTEDVLPGNTKQSTLSDF